MASQLAEAIDLSLFKAVYDDNNKKIKPTIYEAPPLDPPARKHTFAPEVDSSTLIDDEAVFQALHGIDWSTDNF